MTGNDRPNQGLLVPEAATMHKPSVPAVNRRTVFAGAGVAGALAATTALPLAKPPAEPAPTEAVPERTGGYQLTEHVKLYYAKARV